MARSPAALPDSSAATEPLLLRWARAMARFNRYMSEDFLGGPRVVRLATVINLQKGGTLPFVALLMWWTGHRSVAAFVYLGLHGSYGLCWLLKHVCFPDARWNTRVTFGGALTSWLLVLGLYWVAPIILIAGVAGSIAAPSGVRLAAAIVIHTVGVVIMMTADAQKHFTLRVRPGLIEDGLHRFVRHPNYLGEMMVYGSYAFLVGHWLPWVILAWVWSQVFLVNILMKEASLSRHPGWAAYKARTGLLLPRLWRARG